MERSTHPRIFTALFKYSLKKGMADEFPINHAFFVALYLNWFVSATKFPQVQNL